MEVWVTKERPDKFGHACQPFKRPDCLLAKVFETGNASSPDTVMLYILPDPFIRGQLRRTSRKIERNHSPGYAAAWGAGGIQGSSLKSRTRASRARMSF